MLVKASSNLVLSDGCQDDGIQCKAVAEFRISKTRFMEIANSIKEKAKEFRKHQKRLEDFMFA